MAIVNALGRRKSAVARVYVTEGTGKITINKRDLENGLFQVAYRKIVVTIQVGNRTIGGPFLNNVRTNNGLTLFIQHFSFDSTLLCERGRQTGNHQ